MMCMLGLFSPTGGFEVSSQGGREQFVRYGSSGVPAASRVGNPGRPPCHGTKANKWAQWLK